MFFLDPVSKAGKIFSGESGRFTAVVYFGVNYFEPLKVFNNTSPTFGVGTKGSVALIKDDRRNTIKAWGYADHEVLSDVITGFAVATFEKDSSKLLTITLKDIRHTRNIRGLFITYPGESGIDNLEQVIDLSNYEVLQGFGVTLVFGKLFGELSVLCQYGMEVILYDKSHKLVALDDGLVVLKRYYCSIDGKPLLGSFINGNHYHREYLRASKFSSVAEIPPYYNVVGVIEEEKFTLLS